MESYDFTRETDCINEVQEKIDTLSKAEAKHVSDFIDSLKEKTVQEQTAKMLSWFSVAILPCIQDYAEMKSSNLIFESNGSVMIATLKNQYGFDITESCKVMKTIISLANHIGIDIKEGNASLSLIFDCTTI